MQKPIIFTVAIFLAGSVLCGSATAQQTSPQSSSPSSSQFTTSPAKSSATSGTTKSSTTSTTHRTATTRKPVPIELKTDKDKESYAIGMNIAKGLQSQSKLFDFDPKLLELGMKDALAGGKTLLTEDQMKAALTSLQAQVREKQQVLQAEMQKEMQEKAEANQKAGEVFLDANKVKEGVQVLPDGLQYKVLTEGTGPKPTATDTVVCNYRGTLIDGTEFDSSYKRGQPITIGVTGVIKGWTEALQLMPVGSKWELYIPSNLAYGPRGAGQVIGPNSTLIFQIELLSIKPKPEPSTQQPQATPPPATQPGQTAPQSALPSTPKN
jgi:FKBP-type peptidyl-prolyl cis-trans isomerase FklB